MTEFTLIDKLEKVYIKLERLSHGKKSDTAYSEAEEIARELSSLLPDNNNIRIDINILRKYSYRDSDKGKTRVIEEFKEQSMIDIRNYISMHREIQ